MLYLTSGPWTSTWSWVGPSIQSHPLLCIITQMVVIGQKKLPLIHRPSLEIHVKGIERRALVRPTYSCILIGQIGQNLGSTPGQAEVIAHAQYFFKLPFDHCKTIRLCGIAEFQRDGIAEFKA